MNKLIIICGANTNLLMDEVSNKINEYQQFNPLKHIFPEVRNNLPLNEKDIVEVGRSIVQWAKNKVIIICTHSSLLFDTIRLEIAKGIISNECVEVIWNGADIIIDKRGGGEYSPA